MRTAQVSWTFALLFIPGMVTAAAPMAEPRAEVTPFAAYRAGGEFRSGAGDGETSAGVDTRDGSGWGLGVGWYRDADSFYELLYSRRDAGLRSADENLAGIDLTIEYLQFGGTLLLPQPRGFAGFISLTVGMARFGASSGAYDSDSKLSGSIGGGFRWPVTNNLHAGLGIRGYLTLVESDSELVCVSSGGAAECLLRTSASTFFEAEVHAGLTLRF